MSVTQFLLSAGASDFVAEIEISRGPEPQTHLNPNWIGMHREVFDRTCQNCHSTDDPGGVSNISFCSNSACHGSTFTYAGFDAPALREIILAQLPPVEPEPEIDPTNLGELVLTYESGIGAILNDRCGSCHGDGGIQGLNLSQYESMMDGGSSGIIIIPGDAENSLLVQIQSGEQPHFGQLSTEELNLIINWINAGAQEQ